VRGVFVLLSRLCKDTQPHWVTPLVTTTPRLEQEFRSDVVWQQTKPGAPYSVNLGNSKGLELIPLSNVEIIVGVPPYVMQNSPTVTTCGSINGTVAELPDPLSWMRRASTKRQT
jgi:hypothetical protein